LEYDPTENEPIRIPIEDVLDLHTVSPRDVKPVVEEYLIEVRRAGFKAVRIIHGKGIGAQRDIVRKILVHDPSVEHFGDAPAEAGGWGATLVTFRVDPATIGPLCSARF
jgi:dsDNA-specific endonuclease/ATPase MutS2